MTHLIYAPHTRAANQALIKSLVYPQGKDPMADACTAHRTHFSPSLYAELDWQRFRPDAADPDLRQILDLLHDLLFVIAFPVNMRVRAGGDRRIGLQPDELSRLEPIFDAWQAVWMRPERATTLAAFHRFVEGLRNAPRRALETGLRERALGQLRRTLTASTDRSNLVKSAEQILLNAQYAFLDLPWTRQAVQDALVAAKDPSALIALVPGAQGGQSDPAAFAMHLSRRADRAAASGAEEWAHLLRDAADLLAGLDVRKLDGDDGDWTDSRNVCGQCAMWFAGRTVAAMDDRASFARGTAKPVLYLPHDTMVCSCPFCGFAAPNSVPAFYFAEQRGQVIYLVPTREGISKSDALQGWAPVIRDLQNRYLQHRGGIIEDRFRDAAELITHDLAEFFYAIQMGDTIAEDHVFNLVRMEDGYLLVFDGEKGFARVLTPGEAQVFMAGRRIDDGRAPGSATIPDESRLLKLEEVEGLLEEWARANAAWGVAPTAAERER